MTWTGSECQQIMSNLNLDLVLTIQPTQRVDTTFIWKVCLPVCKDTLLKWHLLCFRQVKENWSRPVICEICKLLHWVSENSHEKTQSSLPGDAKCLQLWYYMEGQGTGTLNVYQQFSDKDRPLLVTQSGEQGGLWRFAQTPLTVSGSSYRVSPWISTQSGDWSQCPAHIAQIIANDGLQVICSCCHWFVQQSRITSCTNMFTKLQSVPSSLMMWNCRSVLINTAVFSDCGGGDCRPNWTGSHSIWWCSGFKLSLYCFRTVWLWGKLLQLDESVGCGWCWLAQSPGRHWKSHTTQCGSHHQHFHRWAEIVHWASLKC